MRVFNFGSLNIDHVYSMDKFVSPGETLPSISYSKFAGGKGLNQSIALAKAGIKVTHLGSVGEDGYFLRDLLDTHGVDAKELQILSSHQVMQLFKWTLMVRIASFFMVALMLKMTRTKFYKSYKMLKMVTSFSLKMKRTVLPF